MFSSYLRALIQEKVMPLASFPASKWDFLSTGVVRLVDRKGNTVALVLSKDVLDEIGEDWEASGPEFIASLEASRRSGRISGEEVKRKAGLK